MVVEGTVEKCHDSCLYSEISKNYVETQFDAKTSPIARQILLVNRGRT